MLGERHFKFGEFEIDSAKRLLRKNGEPLPLHSKTFDLLLVLVENHGEVLTKDELLERVWPGQFVEEGNLSVQIFNLRKIFGEQKNDHRFIVTVPGRGYSFVADLESSNANEIVVERVSLSRIVIEEDVESNVLPIAPKRRPLRSALIVLGAILLIAAPSIYFLIRWNAAPSAEAGFEKLELKRLTTNGRVSFAALSPDGKMFAYALKELEQNSLWLGLVEGGEDKLLRQSETGRYNDLHFSADGNSVLFTFSGADSRESVLYRMPTLGGAREKIRSKVSSFDVSPDGQQYAYGRYSGETKSHQLIVARFDGADDLVIDLPQLRSFGTESISWSPDGNTVAFSATPNTESNHEVFVVDAVGGSPRRITNYGWKEVIKTGWTHSADALLLSAQEKRSNTSVSYSQIWHVAYPSGDARQLTRDLSSYRSVLDTSVASFISVELRQMNNIWVAPSDDLSKLTQVTFGTFGKYDGLWGLDWTANGKIVFTSTDHQSQVISEMDADGGNVHQLTTPGFDDSLVNASTDGRYIVFESTRAGGSDIWRMNSDGSNVVRLTTDGKSYQPFITPDSSLVYYKSFVDDSGAMHRVSIEGGESEKLTETEVSYLSVSPTGTHVAAGIGPRLAVFPIHGGQPVMVFDLPRFGTLSGNTAWTAGGKSIAYRDRGFGYWLQPLEGGEPQRLKGLPMEKFYNFAFSKDGKQLAFVRGQEIRDVVLFRGSR